MGHVQVKHQPFLSVPNMHKLLASMAVLRWEWEKQSCWRELIQVVPMPRSMFEQSPVGQELLSSRLSLTEAG